MELVRDVSMKGYDLLYPLDAVLAEIFGPGTTPFRVPMQAEIGGILFGGVSVADIRAQAIAALPPAFFVSALPSTVIRVHSVATDALMTALLEAYPHAREVKQVVAPWRKTFRHLKMTPGRYMYAKELESALLAAGVPHCVEATSFEMSITVGTP